MLGCLGYAHVHVEVRSKLDPKAEKCIFVGYSEEQKGYRCYNPLTKKIVVNPDVIFIPCIVCMSCTLTCIICMGASI